MLSCSERAAAFASRVHPLPGSVPYDNRRRMGVPGRHDGRTLGEFLRLAHAHIPLEHWQASAEAGRLEIDGRLVHTLATTVRAGNQLVHVIPDQIEPDVASELAFLFEDEALLVLDKPAPLPVHPSGRFNKNTVTGLLRHVFGDLTVLPVHRLDADTTGVLVLAKHRDAARALSRQFEARTVEKTYLAHVHGRARAGAFECDAPVSTAPGTDGKRTTAHGNAAFTRFETVRSGETSLVRALPRSGRTNQIRVHLAALGLPIVGDRGYGAEADAEFSSGGALRLHALSLQLRHPTTGHVMCFESPPPPWAEAMLT